MAVYPYTGDIGMEGIDNKSDDGQKKKGDSNDQPISNLKGGDITALYPFKAHKDIIKSIKYISATDEPLIFTAGLDKMAYIWGLEKGEKGDSYVCRGKLLQGYMMKPNY
jgi:WD40 repeat protein